MEFGVGYSHHITRDQDFVKQLCWLHLAAEFATLQVSEHFTMCDSCIKLEGVVGV